MPTPRPNPTPRSLPGVLWATVAALTLAACSPSASASSPAASAAEPPAESVAESVAANPSQGGTVGGDTSVTISGRSFGDDFTIAAGSSVVFVNDDGFDHTVTNGTDGVAAADPLFDIALAAAASSEPIVFDTPGVYQVTCHIHASMNLTITVE